MNNLIQIRKEQITKIDYLSFLKSRKLHYKSRWIVKYGTKGLVREVKLIFNPEEYRKGKRAKKLNTQYGLIKILENDRKRRLQTTS
tara:strand:+ start:586 stop:843 length:258 start_codon:yes stop_codon:yes gene_type:complete